MFKTVNPVNSEPRFSTLLVFKTQHSNKHSSTNRVGVFKTSIGIKNFRPPPPPFLRVFLKPLFSNVAHFMVMSVYNVHDTSYLYSWEVNWTDLPKKFSLANF